MHATTKWFQIQNGGHNPSCLYKKMLAGNLYCSPSPPHFVAEIWRRISNVFSWHPNQLAEPSRFKSPQNSNNWVYFKIDGLFMIGLPNSSFQDLRGFQGSEKRFLGPPGLVWKVAGSEPGKVYAKQRPRAGHKLHNLAVFDAENRSTKQDVSTCQTALARMISWPQPLKSIKSISSRIILLIGNHVFSSTYIK